jgi:putative transposase
MPRSARIVVPGLPHHVTQRGNRRQETFFDAADYTLYLDLLTRHACALGVGCWAWCLMPNHVHLVLVPARPEALAALMQRVHQAYTLAVNAREGWTGCLWQGRFASYAMDEGHALAAVRYVELNPVTARLCDSARDWVWSSAAAHLDGRLDPLLTRPAFLDRIPDWAAYLETGLNPQIEARIGLFDGPGYPMGEAGWLCELEQRLGQSLRAAPRGRPRMAAREAG